MSDTLWPGGPSFIQRPPVFRLGTDAVLLAHFAETRRARLACDLGCGGGVISILLAWRTPPLTVHGLDLQPEAVALSRENAAINGLSDRTAFFSGDLRRIGDLLPAGKYDLVVSNPPYFSLGSGKAADDRHRAGARDERHCTLEDLCKAAAYLTRWGGRFAVVYRPERLSRLLVAMTAHGLEPKRLRLVALRPESPPILALVEGRRGGGAGLAVEAPLYLQDEAGEESHLLRQIYHRE